MMEKRVIRGAFGRWAACLPMACIGILSADATVLHLDGELRVRGGSLAEAKVIVIPEHGAPWLVDQDLAHFSVKLELQGKYLLSFEHRGSVSKQLLFDTTVPQAQVRLEGYRFPFEVTLEPTPFGEAMEYAGPVGSIHYDPSIRDFGYRTDYRIAKNVQLEQRLLTARTDLARTGSAGRSPLNKAEVADRRPREVLGPNEVLAGTASRMPPLVHVLKTPDTVAELPGPAVEEPPAPTVGEAHLAKEELAEAGPFAHAEVTVGERYVSTDVLVKENGRVVAYRRVVKFYGAVTYFRDGRPCSPEVYRQGIGL